ncbi:putative tartrate transporter [Rhodovastum atsumiense]|uniref:MFS transporter n=1 Tax=Rhodovastum atsumiense TaxID=504468 RepID=A0A5M6IRJ4_9PROT|nr:MFS transporter [Rhodovastum atsumiense]KAA5610902.1 MFS transporter [Rhodovastum atsumiense]CAH2601533.1 putative tartrate transporter [Rhodovastum atsumiense]
MPPIEARTIRKVSLRLIPFLMLCYFVAYLDRVNVGFAALTMNQELGLTATMFGFGSGVFFLAYFLFEVPSNLFLDRFGARRWIARIMVSWGILSGMMAFIPQIGAATGLGNEYAFYLLRILLGAAEAGFFPGIIFYLTLWFPSLYRARIIGMFMAAIPISSAIGSPVSGMILGLHGLAGLAGWQWLFLIEAAPAVILAVVTYFYLTDRPADAAWLAPDERAWLATRLEAERRQREAVHDLSVREAMTHIRVWALALVYFGAVAGLYGVGFWLPQIIKTFGLSNALTGWVVAIPYAVSALCMVWYGHRSDARHERKGHAAVALAVAAVGIAASTLTQNPILTVLAFTLGSCGVFALLPVFWTLPTAVLSGTSAAAGIAVINSVGNLSGFAGPYAMGWIRDATGSFAGGLLLIAGLAILAMMIVLVLGHDRDLEKAPHQASAAE